MQGSLHLVVLAGLEAAPPEVVFRTLDGHDIDVDGARCHVEVCGVHDDGAHRWVQLALDGDRRRMLTVRIGEGDDPDGTIVSVAAA